MKWVRQLERKLFPNDSPYQRRRRRYVIIFSVIGAVLIVCGSAAVITKASNMTGRKIEKAPPRRVSLPTWPLN